MSALQCLFFRVVSLLPLLLCTAAYAQSLAPGRWVGDLYLVPAFSETDPIGSSAGAMAMKSNSLAWTFVDKKNKIVKHIPSIKTAKGFPAKNVIAQVNPYAALWRNDALYVFGSSGGGSRQTISFGPGERPPDLSTLRNAGAEKNEDGSLFRRWTLAKWEDGEWHFMAEYKADPAINIINVIPCDNGRFIVISSRDLNGTAGPSATPFAHMSLPEGKTELRLDAPIDWGQDDLRNQPDSVRFNLFYTGNLKTLMTDSHAVLLNNRTGLYWVFSLEKASLVKSGIIFRKVTPEMIAKGGFTNAILCVNPEKEGTILISAQDEDFFITETESVNKRMGELYQSNPSMTPEEQSQYRTKFAKELVERNPYLFWYRIYPENGKVEKLPWPPDGGHDKREFSKETWRPLPDGSVKMGAFEFGLTESLMEEAKKAEEDAKKESAKATVEPPKANADIKKNGQSAE